MGLQNGRLKNHMMTSSSYWDINHAAHLARLHSRRRGRYMGAWAAKYNNRYQWLRVDFGGAAKIIRISTQGRQDTNQWVTQYYVTHSLDRVHFSEYKERNNRKVIHDHQSFKSTFEFSLFTIFHFTRVTLNSLAGTDKPVALRFQIELEIRNVSFYGGRETKVAGEKCLEQG